MPPLVPQVQSGALRALAVASPLRSPMLPNVPSAAEAGLPGYEVTGWFGLLAPAGTPEPIVTLLHTTLAQILGSDLAKKRLIDGGAEPERSESPQAFAAFINREIARWGEVVKRSGAKVE
jgi:tripartite-type tricarboxylate transporter receptor subunit TctC